VGGMIEQMQAQLNRIEAAVARLAKCGAPGGMLPQRKSPLGSRKHREAVKRRVAEAESQGISPIELGAAIDGETFYLTEEAMAEELGERTRASLARSKGAALPVANDIGSPDEEAAFQAALARGRRARGDAP
jgi:hypothetical protein